MASAASALRTTSTPRPSDVRVQGGFRQRVQPAANTTSRGRRLQPEHDSGSMQSYYQYLSSSAAMIDARKAAKTARATPPAAPSAPTRPTTIAVSTRARKTARFAPRPVPSNAAPVWPPGLPASRGPPHPPRADAPSLCPLHVAPDGPPFICALAPAPGGAAAGALVSGSVRWSLAGWSVPPLHTTPRGTLVTAVHSESDAALDRRTAVPTCF